MTKGGIILNILFATMLFKNKKLLKNEMAKEDLSHRL
jgi:hypothetical protein